MNQSDVLEAAGQILIAKIRDVSISVCTGILEGRIKGDEAEGIRRDVERFDLDERLVLRIATCMVDEVIHNLLWNCEQGSELQLIYVSPNGDQAVLGKISDGLAGEVYGETGWFKTYSKYPS